MRLFIAVLSLLPAAIAADPQVTFSKDVLPVLQKNCQGCHRPGEAGPMTFLDYHSTRPWAKAIKDVAISRKMPPWLADPHVGKFSNDRSLSEADVKTLVDWVDTGSREGIRQDAPQPIDFVEGWTIGKPDKIFEMPRSFSVPASGTIEYQYVVLPTGYTEDKWVRMAEVRPGDRSVVHHVIAFIRPKGSKWLAEAQPGVPFVPEVRKGAADAQSEGSMLGAEMLVGYAPGMPAQVFPENSAKLLPAGADIVFQLHYTTNGQLAIDKTKIGLTFASERPAFRDITLTAANNRFRIPPGDPAHEVKAQLTLPIDAQLVSLMPHMHLRGKDFLYKVVYPDGQTEMLLNVPRYDFAWQLVYALETPIALPKGSRIECTAHFDNSPNNKFNPDPKTEVRWGDQSWEEMMIGFFDIIVPSNVSLVRRTTGE